MATGLEPLQYRWQVYNGSTWENLSEGGQYAGTATAALTVSGVNAAAATLYRCAVQGVCGPDAISAAAELTLKSVRADSDCDDDVGLAGFADFQKCFNGPQRPPACD